MFAFLLRFGLPLVDEFHTFPAPSRFLREVTANQDQYPRRGIQRAVKPTATAKKARGDSVFISVLPQKVRSDDPTG